MGRHWYPGVVVALAGTAMWVSGAAATTANPNVVKVFTTSSTGGTGQVSFPINLAPGVYLASYSASFLPAGTPAAPVTFSCYLLHNSGMVSQSTTTSTYTSGFYQGVNGMGAIRVLSGDTVEVGCGTADGSTWTWGTRPLQVQATKIDGYTQATIPGEHMILNPRTQKSPATTP